MFCFFLDFQIFTWYWTLDAFNLLSLSSSNDSRIDGSLKNPRFISGDGLVGVGVRLSNDWLLLDDRDNCDGFKRVSVKRPGDKIFQK
jgi:hypothetical protein